MSTNQDIAYVVPKTLWERLQTELNQNRGGMDLMNYAHEKRNEGGDQTGGALTGLSSTGGVNPAELMRMLALNMNLTQSPRAAFVGHADKMIKQILEDGSLTDEQKVRYLTSAQNAFDYQKRAAMPSAAPATTTTAAATSQTPPPRPPKPKLSPKPSPSGITPVKVKPESASPFTTPVSSYRSLKEEIQKIDEKMKEITRSPDLSYNEKKAALTKLQERRTMWLRSDAAKAKGKGLLVKKKLV